MNSVFSCLTYLSPYWNGAALLIEFKMRLFQKFTSMCHPQVFLLENCENTQRFRWNVDSWRVYSWILILADCWPHLITSDTGKIRRNESKTATGNSELELLNKKIRRVANTIGQTETELWISVKNDNISWNFILNKSISRRVSDFLAILNLW